MALSGTGCEDDPPADQRDDRCIGPTAKLGVAGGGTSAAWKSLDPRVREPVRKPALTSQMPGGSGLATPAWALICARQRYDDVISDFPV